MECSLPTEYTLMLYVGWRFITSNVVAGSLKNELYGIRSVFINLGFRLEIDAKSMPVLSRVRAGYKKERPNGVNTKKPITNDILHKMLSVVNQGSFNGKVIVAVLCFAKFGLARVSEYTETDGIKPLLNQLCFIPSVQEPAVAVFTFFKSKTNQFGKKETISVGCTCCTGLCALHALANMVIARSFMDRDVSSMKELFVFSSGHVITRDDVSSMITQLCLKCGLNPKSFGTHRLRSGGTTDYIAWGIDPILVAEMGRWKGLKMLLTYNQMNAVDIASNVSRSLLTLSRKSFT